MRTRTDRYQLADTAVWRVGYGAMQLAGPGVFGPPDHHNEVIAVLREAVGAGVDHIDTSHYYGPAVVNELIREALSPYPDSLALVSKVGGRRDEVGAFLPYNDPDQLRICIEDNLRTLDIERLTAVNLRLLDDTPVDERFVDQLGALIAARDEGLIAGIGISNVTHQHLLRALEVTDIVCVQNAYNLADRSSQPVLDECRTHGIAFVPFCPLGGSRREHQAIRANPGCHRDRRRSRCHTRAGRVGMAARDRRQRAADPRHELSQPSRRKHRRRLAVAQRRRSCQPHRNIRNRMYRRLWQALTALMPILLEAK